jgi:hypothetical protein
LNWGFFRAEIRWLDWEFPQGKGLIFVLMRVSTARDSWYCELVLSPSPNYQWPERHLAARQGSVLCPSSASPWNYSMFALAAVVVVISMVLLGRNIQAKR